MIERSIGWIEERLVTNEVAREVLRKAFPDHWSFMLGEINVYCFAVLLLTGTWLAFFFDPTHVPIAYHGNDRLLDGQTVSTAYASALHLSFDVSAGLFVRQMHHWAALVFIAGIALHMGRVFFTGAFRRPRELTWMVGIALLGVALFEGFAGYSLPDDLLSGLGLRIAYSVTLSLPLIGSRLAFLLTGGAFPSEQLGPRLFVLHVYMLPAAIAGLIGLHLLLVWHQKHTQFRGLNRTEANVVGSPLYPNYALRSFALGTGVVSVLGLLGALVQINPVWLYGPYLPWQAISPAQPDWYLGWVDGALRVGPPWALHIFGHLIPPVFWAGVVVPAVFMGVLFLWPYIEQLATKDYREHHLLDRPLDAPVRTAIGAGLTTFAAMLIFAGSDDVQARYTYLSVIQLTTFYRVATLTLPVAVAILTYLTAISLQRNGIPSERVGIVRTPAGGYDEESIR